MQRKRLLPDSVPDNLASLVAAVDQAEKANNEWRSDTHIHFLRNFTIEPIEPYLKFHLLRDDIKPEVTFGGYDTISQEILDPDSLLSKRRPDVIVLSLLLELFDSNCTNEGWTSSEVLTRLDDLLNRLAVNTNSIIVANTFILPVEHMRDNTHDDALESEIEILNGRLQEFSDKHPHGIIVIDWQSYLPVDELSTAIDNRFWVASQAPFKPAFLNSYAENISRFVRLLKGHARKCLILDCDNTLWGGVVGEDGPDGILLDPADASGAAFSQFQQAVVELQKQGVMLALCSKNNEQDVWEVLDEHPHSILRKSHLVAWRINWKNKAENIESIARELNIGTESLVFVDDSPQECMLINKLMPDVQVIQVPTELAHYSELLANEVLFDTRTRSDEDQNRTKMYHEEKGRKDDKKRFDDLTEYLQSLNTSIEVARSTSDTLPRIAQLTQKTNQFNLTTQRYSEADILAFHENPNTAVFTMSVSDRYGDMGLTGVLIARREKQKGIIDTLLLSCRVLGRQLEFAFVDQSMTSLEKIWDLDRWEAEFSPTKKNVQVANFWDRVGFEGVDDASGSRFYSTNIGSRPTEYSNIMSIVLENA